MTFDTQAAAKRFVVAKVIEQAEREGVSLSAAERHMLSWSESDPDFVPDPTLVEAQEKEIPEAEFEAKIAGLIQRAYDRDAASDGDVRSIYRAARSKLSEGDHYILVMMDRALKTPPEMVAILGSPSTNRLKLTAPLGAAGVRMETSPRARHSAERRRRSSSAVF